MERMCSKMICLGVFLLPCCHYRSESRPLNPAVQTSDTREKLVTVANGKRRLHTPAFQAQFTEGDGQQVIK